MYIQPSLMSSAVISGTTVLDAFAKFSRAILSFVVCLSVRMEQLGSHWTHFQEISYLNIFRKSVENVKVALVYDKNNGHFTLKT
jgi:hypothetical protein